MSCTYDSDYNGYLDDYGNPCYPDENQYGGGGGGGGGGNGDPYDWSQYGGGGSNTGGGSSWPGGHVPPSITVTPGGIQVAPTNLDKWLKSISEWTALLTHQSSIPTPGANSNSQIRYPSNITPIGTNGLPLANSSNLGGNVGASLQKFFSSTTGLLVIGAAVLLYMKPPGKR